MREVLGDDGKLPMKIQAAQPTQALTWNPRQDLNRRHIRVMPMRHSTDLEGGQQRQLCESFQDIPSVWERIGLAQGKWSNVVMEGPQRRGSEIANEQVVCDGPAFWPAHRRECMKKGLSAIVFEQDANEVNVRARPPAGDVVDTGRVV